MSSNAKYVLYKEGTHYVAQCLNVDVSSFGDSVEEAINNIKEAIELYFEDNDTHHFIPVSIAMIGDMQVNV